MPPLSSAALISRTPRSRLRGRYPVEEHEGQDHVGAHAGPDRELRIGSVGRIDRHHGARAREAEVEAEVGGQVHLDHPVDPLAVRRVSAPGRPALGSSPPARRRRRGRAPPSGAAHVATTRAPAVPGQLDGEVADRAGSARHQHGAPVEVTVGEQAAVGGQRRHPEAAPSSSDAPSGSATARRSETTVHSAAVPHWLPAAAIHQTRLPARSLSTPGPTASMAPAPS